MNFYRASDWGIISDTYPNLQIAEFFDVKRQDWWCTFADGERYLAPFSHSLKGPILWLLGYLENGIKPPRMFPRFDGEYRC